MQEERNVNKMKGIFTPIWMNSTLLFRNRVRRAIGKYPATLIASKKIPWGKNKKGLPWR